jgi:hypothetical protein
LEEGPPAAPHDREKFIERFDGDRGFSHLRTYSASSGGRQSALGMLRRWKRAGYPGTLGN